MILQWKKIGALLLPLLLLLSACNSTSNNSTYIIARDPSWYPLDLMGKENNVYGFTTDLLHAIAKEQNLSLELVNAGWNQLISGLKNESYDAVLSSITPTVINESKFNFSQSLLDLGPVIIVRINSNVTSLDDLKEKIVGVSAYTNEDLIIQTIPTIIIKPYENLSQALEDVASGRIDGAVMGKIIAETYLKDLYHGQLKIATVPLNQKGLRLMALSNQEINLITSFNEGLTKIKKNGTYLDLLAKWKLSY